MQKTGSIFIIVSCLFVLIVGCGQAFSDDRNSPALAVVAGERIELDEFRTGYIDFLLQTGLEDTPRYRSHFLNSRIAAHLLAQEARRNGLHETQDFSEATARIEKKLLVDVYVQKALFDTLKISEDELKDMFVRARTTLTARHLYAPTKNAADKLYQRLMNGESFEALALEVFADTALANNAGSVGEFTLDDMDPAFEEAAFALKIGEISLPVRTRQGYSIIQLQDRFVKPLLTEYEFAEKRDRMEHFVTYRKKTAAKTQHKEDLLQKLKLEFHEPGFRKLLNQIQGDLTLNSDEDPDVWLNEPLVSFYSKDIQVVWSVKEFREMAGHSSDKQRAAVKEARSLEDFITGLILREEMIRNAFKRGYDRLQDVQRARDRAHRDWLWDEATRRLYKSVVVPEDTLRAHYEAYPMQEPARTQVWEILVQTKKEAEALRLALEDESFEELARRHSIRPGAAANGGDLDFLAAEQLGSFVGPVSSAQEGAILGPLEFKGHYALLKIGGHLPARPLRYEEARPEIIRLLEPHYRKAELQAQVAKLKDSNEISINKTLLEGMVLKSDERIAQTGL